LLARYYFLNNVNIWGWGLYGNKDPKGWEVIPTDEDEPEFGGRIQVPMPYGEIGASYHYRKVDINKLMLSAGSAPSPPKSAAAPVREDRVGFDAKWDLGVGILFEGAVFHQDSDVLAEPYQHLLTFGADYTFGIGEGLTVLGEHFLAVSSRVAFGKGTQNSISGASLTYPWGLVDSFGLILYYDYDTGDFYNFMDWRRQYDRWVFHLMGFVNPQSTLFIRAQRGDTPLEGSGVKILIVFNH
jgi:hypothetical protein